MDIKNFDYHFYIYINDLNATILDTEGNNVGVHSVE